MTVNDVYTQVCDTVLEPVLGSASIGSTGLQLGTITQQQLLDFFSDVLDDYYEKTRMVRKLFNVPVSTGIAQYPEPDVMMELQAAFYSERYIYREQALDLDNLQEYWRTQSGSPQRWNEDRLPLKTVQLTPIPQIAGFTIVSSANFFGTISNFSTPNDLTLAVTANFFGTISSYNSAAHLDTLPAFFGTTGNAADSTNNLMMVATARMPTTSYQFTDLIQLVPDSFVMYLKYGVLAKIFSMDGEMKDPMRQKYCDARYTEGINLAHAVMLEMEGE